MKKEQLKNEELDQVNGGASDYKKPKNPQGGPIDNIPLDPLDIVVPVDANIKGNISDNDDIEILDPRKKFKTF